MDFLIELNNWLEICCCAKSCFLCLVVVEFDLLINLVKIKLLRKMMIVVIKLIVVVVVALFNHPQNVIM